MSKNKTIKELVIDACRTEGGFPSEEKLTALVKKHYPNSAWKKSHYSWYKSQIKTGRIPIESIAEITHQTEGTDMARLSTTVIEQLGWYVYLYIDPCGEQEEVFYVGKGQGSRVLDHLTNTHNMEMNKRIKKIRSKGYEPLIDILIDGLSDEKDALRIESAAIDLLGIDTLTNEQSGHGSLEHGRISLDELILHYDAEEAEITDPVLLFRINQLFEYGMTTEELYKATRGVWDVDVYRAKKVKYALAVYGGVVREVYEVDTWFPADTLKNYWTPFQQKKVYGRYAFNGRVAEDSIRNQYNDKSVEGLWPRGAQKAFRYVNA